MAARLTDRQKKKIADKRDLNLNFDFSSLDFDGISMPGTSDKEKRFVRSARIKHKPVAYKNALEMANAIDITQDYFSIVSGDFIFGDFIEAVLDVHNLEPERVLISTLGMNQNNVDSIVNMVDYLGTQRVGLIVSAYFYGVERHKLIPYMVKEFGGRPICIGVCQSHAKMALIKSAKTNLVMFGSANLSSSNNAEEFAITHDPAVFDYCNDVMSGILNDFRFFDGPSREAKFEYGSAKEGRGQQLFERVSKYGKR